MSDEVEETSGDASKNAKKGRPFEPGNKKGIGRPVGSRNNATILLEKMMADDGEKVVQAVLIAAQAGDMTAARLVLDRICQPRKGRAIKLDLPKVETAADLMGAMGVVVDAMAQGEISPDEATAVGGVLELRRKSIETAELEARIVALEAKAGEKR